MSNLQFTNEDYSDIMFLVYKKGVDKILKQIADENEKSERMGDVVSLFIPDLDKFYPQKSEKLRNLRKALKEYWDEF